MFKILSSKPVVAAALSAVITGGTQITGIVIAARKEQEASEKKKSNELVRHGVSFKCSSLKTPRMRTAYSRRAGKTRYPYASTGFFGRDY
jgi:hypothetical protein